jgi:hypothetical protein
VGKQRVGFAAAVVGMLGRRVHRDAVEPLERELRLPLVASRLCGGERLRRFGRIGAGRPVERAPQAAQLLELLLHRCGAVSLDAGRERERPGAEVVHGAPA